MMLYRLTKCAFAKDMSGNGARLYGGRWNSEGKSMLYLAESRSLAVLEVLVHLPIAYVPEEYCMVTIEAPDDFAVIDEKLLPGKWQDFQDIEALKRVGNLFLTERKKLFLKVPSAIVPQEFNYLLNPYHPYAQKVKLKIIQPFGFDSRLFN